MVRSGWSSASMCRSLGDGLGRTVDFVTTAAVGCSVVSLNGRGGDRRGGGRLTHGASGHMVAVSPTRCRTGRAAGWLPYVTQPEARRRRSRLHSVRPARPTSGARIGSRVHRDRHPFEHVLVEVQNAGTWTRPIAGSEHRSGHFSQRQLRIPLASRRLVDVSLERACHLHRLASAFMTRAARHTLVSHTAPDTCA
jgi:hypothetical protein